MWTASTAFGTMISDTPSFNYRNTTNYPIFFNLSDYSLGNLNDMYEVRRI
jgi:hypothetical protein